MRVLYSIGFFIALLLVGSAVGALIGAAVGAWLPGYYQAVVPRQPGHEIDPIQVGIGMGLNAGLFAGGLLAMLLLILSAWRAHRSQLQKTVIELTDEVRALHQIVARLSDERTGPDVSRGGDGGREERVQTGRGNASPQV
jgi:hypothetical protein